ncbi:MAG: nucleotidyltransferase domain-containing protein [Mariprofundaceae bacterium]|nr:nucleotidyltransferase domain-containing protein [Mariprofundaceae bacterium]
MRLRKNQALAIKELVKNSLGPQSEVWLFGSRTNDLKRGGDVDLYIESPQICLLQAKLRLMTKIQLLLGLRKVDLIIKTPASPDRTIHETAKHTGIHL